MKEQAAALVQASGRLPLVLDQMGAHIVGSYYCGCVLGLLVSAWHHRGWLCIFCHAGEALLMAAVAFVPLPLGAIYMMTWRTLNGVLVVVTLCLVCPPRCWGV